MDTKILAEFVILSFIESSSSMLSVLSGRKNESNHLSFSLMKFLSLSELLHRII